MKCFRTLSLIFAAAILLGGTACASSDYAGYVSSWNANMEAQDIDPSAGLSDEIDPSIVSLSNEIIGSETDPETQVKLIYEWVTSHIYYDMDAFRDGADTFHNPVDVAENRRGECDGFSLLFQALVQAQGIPCILCQGYALGQSTSGIWTEENYMLHEINHNWNEVYLNGEWQRMDTTWDVNNAYTSGLYFDGDPSSHWYHFSVEMLDTTRRIDVRGPISYDQIDTSAVQAEDTSNAVCDFISTITSSGLSPLLASGNVMLILLAIYTLFQTSGL